MTTETSMSTTTAKRLRLVASIAIIAFLVIVGLAGYFGLRNIAQVETFHARVAGHVVTVASPTNGRLVELPVEVGDFVAQDEEIAVLEALATTSQGGQRVLLPIRAPISGIVVTRPANEGDARTTGQTILTIVDPNDIWVEATIHESRIARVKVGQPVRVRIRALKMSFPGRVEQISQATTVALGATGLGAATSNPVEVPVRISVDTRGYRLYPGMSAEIHVQVEPRLW